LRKKTTLNKKSKFKETNLTKTTHVENKKEFQDYYDLPSSYNTTSITLIARDPYWIFAYWEITQSSIEELRKRIGSLEKANYVIRMYDVTYINFDGTNANRVFDIEIDPNAKNWYINLWNDNSTFCADLGIRFPDGRFYQLARSNFVTTPRFRPSDRSEEIWMEVKQGIPQKPYVMARVEEKPKVPTKEIKEPQRKYRRFNLTEEDIKKYYSNLSPLLKEIIAKRLARTWKFRKPKPTYKRLLKGIHLKDIHLYREGSIMDLLYPSFWKKFRIGASEELVLWQGASEALFSGASQQILPSQKKRAFYFEIGTELIVYGRTEPDASVFLNNKNIKLNSDGTFSLRFALGDGVKIPLDFVAESGDKEEKREISTSVERAKTIYNP